MTEQNSLQIDLEHDVPEKPAVKKHYVDNVTFEKMITEYRDSRDSHQLDQICDIFSKIAERVYNIAVRNIYSNVGTTFPMPNYHDKQDMVQNAVCIALRAIDHWTVNYEKNKIKSKAFNYFTCCIVYSMQTDLRKELRKGWWKSDAFLKDFTIRYVLKTGLKIYRDFDNFIGQEE